MNFDAATLVSLIAAVGLGGIFQALVGYFKDRKKIASDSFKVDIDTQLATLNTVIDGLQKEVKRIGDDRDKIREELISEQEHSAKLRMRVRELEEEIDGVRRAARETQNKCDELANKLQDLLKDAQEK